jgi:hypothetical protein
VFQVKAGAVNRGDVSKFNNDRIRERAELGIFLTLHPATQGMKAEANAAGRYEHRIMGRSYDRISIVTIKEIVEDGKRLEIPKSLEVLKTVQRVVATEQLELV